jgi:hypothetical protein
MSRTGREPRRSSSAFTAFSRSHERPATIPAGFTPSDLRMHHAAPPPLPVQTSRRASMTGAALVTLARSEAAPARRIHAPLDLAAALYYMRVCLREEQRRAGFTPRAAAQIERRRPLRLRLQVRSRGDGVCSGEVNVQGSEHSAARASMDTIKQLVRAEPSSVDRGLVGGARLVRAEPPSVDQATRRGGPS